MRFGLARFFALVMLCCTPALVMGATAKSNGKAPAAKSVGKAPVRAKAAKPRYNAPVFATIVVDAATGQVLSEANADTRGYPASLTKMMTLYLLFEALERGVVRADTAMPVSARAAAAAPSKLGLRRKSTITVENAVQALITKSANDVAVVTAEYLGGTEDRFAEQMTARAHALGMAKTTFKNASGLPNPQQFSSARDMAVLANHLISDFPAYYGQFSRMDFVYKGQNIRTHNRLLEFYEGADGIKTGYTAASGYNLVGSATRNGYRVIGVMFGATSASSRDRRLAGLMDQGFAALSGQPEIAIAGRGTYTSDQIGTQIAQAQGVAGVSEEGDRDEPFTPVTRSGAPIETTSLAPLPENSSTNTMAALSPQMRAGTAPRATVPASRPDLDGTSGIQIGAFSARARAENQATSAVVKLKATFASAAALVIPVRVKGRMVFRARVMGLDDKDLLRACALIPAHVKAGGCQAIRPEAKRVASR